MNIYEKLSGLGFDAELDDDELVTDALILARVTRMSDGRSTFAISESNDLDHVTRAGLLEIGRQVSAGGWREVEDDE